MNSFTWENNPAGNFKEKGSCGNNYRGDGVLDATSLHVSFLLCFCVVTPPTHKFFQDC